MPIISAAFRFAMLKLRLAFREIAAYETFGIDVWPLLAVVTTKACPALQHGHTHPPTLASMPLRPGVTLHLERLILCSWLPSATKHHTCSIRLTSVQAV